MKRELGIARCGLACCLCEIENCAGCNSGDCPDKDWCENRSCSLAKNLNHCYECPEEQCRKGILSKVKPYAFTLFVKRYGEEKLLDCLGQNEKNGIVYHREGFSGDYDTFQDAEALIVFILTGKK